MNKKWILAERPQGAPAIDNFKLVEEIIPQPKPGEVFCKTLWLSLDPYMRALISEIPLISGTYADPLPIGSVISGETVAQVIASNDSRFKPGDKVAGYGGWQSYWSLHGESVRPLHSRGYPLSWNIGLMGMPGISAYMGLMDIGKPQAGETLVVAAASGPVGSLVGQIAKRVGLRVVGIAGAQEKCRFVVEQQGFDACVSHYDSNLKEQLCSVCPDGVDIYFENVAGKVFEAVFPLLNNFARVPVCGAIAVANAQTNKELQGKISANDVLITSILKQLHIQGFLMPGYQDKVAERFRRDMQRWMEERPFVYREDITQTIEKAPEAFIQLLQGGNLGKAVVKVAELED